ncbi:hypothetical protein GDO78_003425 [Eleutherodactylus coqui]|uniref:Uncharacterized protein n=1 Tax=Eleutherodactylus coqui TaxID=57060 RepID=A0A8J6K0G5_ELECQ|nr:hypothetical protein GDO78_003425 [Eleutherodactylus coqui]
MNLKKVYIKKKSWVLLFLLDLSESEDRKLRGLRHFSLHHAKENAKKTELLHETSLFTPLGWRSVIRLPILLRF